MATYSFGQETITITTAEFSICREDIIDHPEQFVALYEALECLGDNSVTQYFLERQLFTALQRVKYGYKNEEVSKETYFASLIIKFMPILRNNKRLRLAIQELTKFLFEGNKFNPKVAEAYLIDRMCFVDYISQVKDEKETKEWLIAHPEVMYECFVAKIVKDE